MKTCAFLTLGCKVNQYETQAIREQFAEAGLKEVSRTEEADVCIINTCTVTSQADKQSLELIRKVIKFNPDATVVVTGCLTQMDAEVIKNIPGVDFVVRNNLKDKMVNIVLHFNADDRGFCSRMTADYPRKSASRIIRVNPVRCLLSNGVNPRYIYNQSAQTYLPLHISDFKDHSRAFVKIQDGCNNYCSYCKVSLIRGRSRSRPLDNIKTEIQRLLKRGFKEIVLTGVCLGSYGLDLPHKLNIVNCLDKLDKINGDFRIRLSSIEPKDIHNSLIEKMASSPKLCQHLHLPFQSGDDEILKKMNRNYSSFDYKRLVERIRKSLPNIAITTDILVGFPGERDENFRNTLEFIEEIQPCRVHIFPYSKRKGTFAYNFKEEVPLKIIKDRMNELRVIALKNSLKFRQGFLNKAVRVLVEALRDRKSGLLKGYSDNYIKIFLEGSDELINHLIWTKIIEIASDSTYAIPIPEVISEKL